MELTAENERLRDALTTLHARFTQCSKESMSAYEAYDSFYQEVVSDALEARVFPNAPIAPADEN